MVRKRCSQILHPVLDTKHLMGKEYNIMWQHTGKTETFINDNRTLDRSVIVQSQKPFPWVNQALYVVSLISLSPLTSEVVGAPQMTLQQYLSTLPCLPLPSGNLQTPFLSIPLCYLPISSSVFLSFLLLSLSPAELSSPCQMILRCGHTI